MSSYLNNREVQSKKDEDSMALEERQVVLLRFLVQQLLALLHNLCWDSLIAARRR
jgi:hypothetical protein